MIRDSLAVVVVARRHSERLSETLASLAADKVPGTVTVVNLTGDSVNAPGATVIDASTTLSLSHAVDRALAESTAEAIWILRDDNRVRPGAFAALASILDTSPSVGIVGPKQMDSESPVTIREMGESMTRSGFALQLAERELDQAQYDRVSDVLAVGEAGMLVRRTVWSVLGGFDPALPAVDGALDFCYRARVAGWLVEVVPTAVIETGVSSFEALAGPVTDAKVTREEARARAHRVLVYSSAAARFPLSIVIVLGAFLRGLTRFARKKSSPFAQWRGTLAGATDIGAIGRSRRALRAVRTQQLDGSRLFVSPAELRHRRALERDVVRAAEESADETPRLTFGVTGLWWTGFAAVAGLALAHRFLGADALAGGALLPLPADLSDVVGAIGATWSDVAGGITGAPDGFAALMAILGTLTWWNPNLVVVALFVLAVPLSFVAGFVGAGSVTTHTRVAVMVGVTWALVPTLHVAIAEGRITAVLAHVALPFFARAITGSTIVSLGWASITAAIIWTSIPALAPVLVIAVILRAVTGSPTALITLVTPLAFEWPRLLAALGNPVTYFADRGLPLPVTAPHGGLSLTLWPATPDIPFVGPEISVLVAFVVVAVAVSLTVIAVVVAENPRLGGVLVLGGIALLTWAGLATVPLATVDGQVVGLFPGPLYDVVWFGLLVGVAITLGSIRFMAGSLRVLAVASVAVLGAGPIAATALGTSLVSPSTFRTLPAFVEAESIAHRGGATLIVTPAEDGIRAELQRDSGVSLLDWTAAAATRSTLAPNEGRIAEIAANLVVESGFDLNAAFTELGIRFVLLKAKPTATEVSAIASHAGLTSVGATDRGILWRVTDAVEPVESPRNPDAVYVLVLGLVGMIALIAAIPTSLPRRKPVVEDVIPLNEEDDDDRT